jgi:hypothetical protein
MGKGTGTCNERVSLQLDTPSSSPTKNERYTDPENKPSKIVQPSKSSDQSKPVIDEHGTKRWHTESGQLHREDGPAIEHANGASLWYQRGQLHREDGPAIEWPNGHKEWWLNGQRHREDGPAIESSHGKRWYLNGELQR